MVRSKIRNAKWIAPGVSAFTLAFATMAPSHAATVAAVPGWNLLGYSDAAAVKVSDAFGDAAKLTTVWKWDAASSKWAFYSPSFATPTDLANYAASKGYLVLTTINSGEGFWVNAKASFSATLPAAPAQVDNTEALAGIQATWTALETLYATAVPSSADLAALFDDTLLVGGTNKADFVQGMLAGHGPSLGIHFVNLALVNPVDTGAMPNDATHQWVTIMESSGGGPGAAWLAIKNSDGVWRLAGDQRLFGVYADASSVKHIPNAQQMTNGAQVNYSSQLNLGISGDVPASVSSIVVSGPGVQPSAGFTVYSVAQGKLWVPDCGMNQSLTYCVDTSQATAGAQYTFKVYTAAGAGGATTLAYAYTSVLNKAPLSTASLAAAPFPTITGVSESWAPGAQVTVNWTLPTGTKANYLSISAWASQGGALFSSVGVNLPVGSTSATITVPNYTGTIFGRYVWLSNYDASGNQLGVDYQLSQP